jgi:DNA-nicking Smr family endonuclease
MERRVMTKEQWRPTDGTLLLPHLRSREVKILVPRFLAACRERQIYEVWIIHGRNGERHQQVLHSVLKDMPEVACFRSGGMEAESVGATRVILFGPDEYPEQPARSR